MDDPVVKSAGRAFAVLELFDETRGPLTATEIVRRLALPQSSTVALLKSMVSLGYLAYDQFDRRYLPTMRVAMQGAWLMDSLGPDGRLLQMIRAISDETEETVALSAQTDLAMQFLHVERGTKPLTLTVTAGDRTALLKTIIGLVALSGRPDATIARYVERTNRQVRDSAQHADLAAVMREVSAVRRRGYGVGDSDYATGVGALAWLLPPIEGDRRVVLSVAGAAEAIRAEREHIVGSVTSAMKVHLDV